MGKQCAWKILISSVLFFVVSSPGNAQDVLQRVRGTVGDALTLKPLVNANVTLSRDSVLFGTTTDENGNFELKDVTPNRYHVKVTFTGYAGYDQELLVISGREVQLQIQLTESSTLLNEVEVGATATVHELVPGEHIIGIEKTMRIPANYFDPVRMTTSYPGVVAANDQGNSIIVKGNSPNGLLWRLNGLDIVNPNHLANAGTLSDKPISNGGGVNILSAQMLDNTTFYSGSFPATFGNAMSGILDMNLRDGNKNKSETTIQASLLGLDASFEAPVGKNHNTSVLANYRYSTVGLLSKLGVPLGDEDISFQDFSLNLKYDHKNGGALSFFGFGGNSKNHFDAKDSTAWEEDKDKYTIDYKSITYAVGTNYTVPVGKGNIFVGIVYSATDQQRDANVSKVIPVDEERDLQDEFRYTRSLVSTSIRYATKVGGNSKWDIGLMTNFQYDDVSSSNISGSLNSPAPAAIQKGNSSGIVVQPFTTWHTTFSEKLSMNLGVRYIQYSYNKTNSLEPRASVTFTPTAKSALTFSYGLVSQLQQPTTYFVSGNKNLEFTKSHRVELGFKQQLSQAITISGEVYYQRLFDVPVEVASSSYSVINSMEGFASPQLVSKGIGDNRGVTVLAEKQFYAHHYFMVGGTYYQSTYKGSDNINRDTRFNGKFTLNGVYGKEWANTQKKRVIGLNLRALYLGGLRVSTIDVAESTAENETVFDTVNPYNQTLNNYFRLDARLSFRKNRAKYTRTFAIDIQNLTNQKNEAYQYFDLTQQKVITKYQLGIIPVLVYRIDF